jgi:hypothetical protein
MRERKLRLLDKEYRFNIEIFPNTEKAHEYIAQRCSRNAHPPFCIGLELFREPSGLSNKLVTTFGDVVPIQTVEVWENSSLDGIAMAELIVGHLKRPKGEEEMDKQYDPEVLKAFLVRCYTDFGLRVFRVRTATIILKPITSLVSAEAAAEVARFDREVFGSPSGKRSLKAVAKDFVESGLVVVGYD